MIQVSKKWFIDSDGSQYILFRKEKYISKKDNEEKERQADCSYHSTVSSALSYLIKKMQKKLTKEKEMTLSEAVKRFQEIENVVLKSANGNEI